MIKEKHCPPVPSTVDLQGWALWYAKRGWQVLPLRPRDKTPITKHGLKDATTDLDRIEKWWKEWPTANIGIRTGPESGLFVLDVDARNGGIDSLDELTSTHGVLPETPESHTGGGGRHYLFSYPTDTEVGNSAGRVASGIDVRGRSGYFVAPPSVHQSGQAYEWEISSSPDETELAPAPDWLLDALGQDATPTNRVSEAIGHPILVGTRNDQMFRMGCSLRERYGCTRQEIEGLLMAVNRGRCVDEGGNPAPLPEEEVCRIARNITDRYEPGPSLEPVSGNGGRPARGGKDKSKKRIDKRPRIRLKGGELHSAVNEAEDVILNLEGDGIYQRGGVLVRPVRLDPPTVIHGIKRRPNSLVIQRIESLYLMEILTQAAIWTRYDKRSRKRKQVDCPERIAKVYIARSGSWRVPTLRGIIEAPTLRPDGSILSMPGYDEQTGLFFDPGGRSFNPVPEHPTREEADAALAMIQDLLRDFPFVSDPDRSVAISAILSGLIRRSLRTAPLHAIGAPKMRSGKTLLADSASLIATGRPCSVMSQCATREEERKRLLAVLLEGDLIICYDNVDRPLGGAPICQALTQESITDRLLGASKIATAPTNALFLATGNNLVFEGDVTSRVLPCYIDPNCERPEERTFDRDLYDYIPAHRERLVPAALTILRAYHVEGRPDLGLKPWGGFDDWSNWVRAAIVWLGMPDPAVTRKRVEELDPVRSKLKTLLTLWDEEFGSAALTVQELVSTADRPGKAPLRAALEEIGSFRAGPISNRTVGKFLSANDKRIEGGLKIERAGTRQGTLQWRVVKV